MFRIMKIPSAERFFKAVDESRGQVWLCLPEGSRFDLKKDEGARQLIRITRPGPEGLPLTLSDSSDLPAFLRTLAG